MKGFGKETSLQRRRLVKERERPASPVTVLCDGLCKPTNPGGLGCWGFAVLDIDGREIAHGSGCIGSGPGMSNNVAEYQAVIEALRWVERNAPTMEVEIRTDSHLVVSQTNGTIKCNAEHLCGLRDKAAKLLGQTRAKLIWIPRDQNKHADAHSKLAYHRTKSQLRNDSQISISKERNISNT
jgi:ribonuclease HI